MRLSVIVPFHRNLDQLRRSLAALKVAGQSLPDGVDVSDVLVVADGARDDPREVAAEHGAMVLVIAGPRGPATARNRGAAVVSGDVLVFVDTDVVVSRDALARVAARFVSQPDLGAAFGTYDEDPADAGFISQCKNLGHSFVHQRGSGDAQTFWAGLGAVRAEVFAGVGGFDERFRYPSVEDIDLGYRIREAGHRIVLDPAIQGKHLKRWTIASVIVTDLRDRGVPWTQLLHRYGGLHNDLNITPAHRASVVMAYVMAGCLIGALRWPELLALVPIEAAILWWLDGSFYRFFATRRGIWFALAWFPFQVVHHLSNGVSFVLGTVLSLGQRWTRMLPWTLPVTPWPVPASHLGDEAAPGPGRRTGDGPN